VLFWAAFAIPVWYEARWDAYTIHGACTALLLLHFVHDPNTFNGRVLNSRPLVWVGLISYSLYAWQQLFFFGFRASWLRSLPAKWVGAFTVACLSYFLVERWSLRVRQRFTARYASQRP